MTREEQIHKAAEEKYIPDISPMRYKHMIYKAMLYSHQQPAFIDGAKWADANRWVRVEDRLPQAVEGKMRPVLVLHGKFHAVAYYFPEHFKTVEWEDWDDYNAEDFPYTEDDKEKQCVWLRPGFYQSVDCDKCDGYWSHPLLVTKWQPLPEPPKGEQ